MYPDSVRASGSYRSQGVLGACGANGIAQTGAKSATSASESSDCAQTRAEHRQPRARGVACGRGVRGAAAAQCCGRKGVLREKHAVKLPGAGGEAYVHDHCLITWV
jgi:hypothetical protein